MQKKLFLLLLLFISIHTSAQERIQMRLEKGVYTIPCTINGLRLRFIFDTGASKVLISATEAAFMLKNEYICNDDFQNIEEVVLADGSVVENAVIVLKEVKIGSKILNNVTAYVSNNIDAPLLLGQSAISLLGTWHISNDTLILGDSASTAPIDIDAAVKQYETRGDLASAYNLLTDAIVQDDYQSYEKWINFVNKNWSLLNTSKVDIDEDLFAQLLFEAVMADYAPLVMLFKENHTYYPFYNMADKAKRRYYYQALFRKGYHIVGKYLAQIDRLDSNISFENYIYYLESSAKLGDVDSYNSLGSVYNPSIPYWEFPDRIPNVTKALYWYKKSADRNDPDGQYFYATILLEQETSSPEQKIVAFDYLKKSANSGNTAAISELVTEYYYGGNIKRNLDLALFWAKKIEGDWQYKWWANAYIGFIYDDKGEKQIAATYLEKAIKVKQEARNVWMAIPLHTYGLLGEMYYWGEGVPKNIDTALKLFLAEIEKSDPEDVAYCYMYVGEIYDSEENYAKALPYVRCAAEHNVPPSQNTLSKYYVLGEVTGNPDFKKTEEWAQRVINNENASDYDLGYAYRSLGNIYSSKNNYVGNTQVENVLYNMQKAIINYEKASSYKDGRASYYLGEIYENGVDNVHKNFKLAEKYYRLASEQGYTNANEKLKLFE